MDETPDFSVIKFFNAFKSRIEKINTFPLSTDNLVIHQDLLKLLADEEVEFNYPFASVAMDRPRSFDDLLFTLELYDKSFTLSIDQQYPFEIQYDALHLDEEQLADSLVDILTGLANGQILTLMTMVDEDKPQAVEILYRQKEAKLFNVLRTFTFFNKNSKGEDVDYSTKVVRNDFDIDEVKVNKKLLEQLVPYSLEMSVSNRKPFADLSEPLTKEFYKKNVDDGSEIWSQNATAQWFPGYGPKNKTKGIEKFVAYSYYRYIEVTSVLAAAVTLLTLGDRQANANVLIMLGIVVFAVVASIYLRRVGKASQVFGVIAYVAVIMYGIYFYNAQLDGFWQWFVAILAFEPVVEMLIADFYSLSKRLGSKK